MNSKHSEASVVCTGQWQCMAVTQRTRAILVHFNHSEQRLAWSNSRLMTDNTVFNVGFFKTYVM